MAWLEIGSDVWTIPAGRYKTKIPNEVPLTDSVRVLLGEPKKAGYVFSTTGGKRPFSGFGKAKIALDQKIAEIRKRDGRKPMTHWVLHDLRRTARSLLSRTGVPADIGERVLGHVIHGVRGVYDRHSYLDEKRDALTRLAALIETIIGPPSQTKDVVVPEAAGTA